MTRTSTLALPAVVIASVTALAAPAWAQEVGEDKDVKLVGEEGGPSADDALALYSKLVSEEPDNSEYRQLLAVAYAELGRVDAARREAKEGIRRTPNVAELHQTLGLIEERAKAYEAAETAYRQAAALSNSVEFRMDIARAQGLQGNTSEEEKTYAALADEFKDNATVLHAAAEHFRENARWDDADRYYGLALGIEPNNADILVDKGRAFSEQARLPEALGAFTRARELAPKDADIHYNIGIIYFRLKQYSPASASFAEAVKLRPSFSRAHNNLGVVFDKQKDNEKALAAFEEATKADEGFGEAWFNKGLSAFKLTRWRQAEAAFKKALEVDPDLADAKFYLGETYYQLKEPSKALAVYKEALRMNPNDADTHRRLGDIHLEKGEMDLAIGEYWAAVDADDRMQDNIRQLMLVLMIRNADGDVRRAAKVGERALEKDPFAVETRAVLADVYSKLGRPLSARKVLEAGIKKAPKSAKMHAAYGTFLLENGKLRDAQLEFEAALRLDKRSHEALYGLGRLDLEKGDKKGAITKMTQALDIRPGFAAARAQLGCVHMYQKQYEEALQELKRATEDDPNNGLAWFCRAFATYNDPSKGGKSGDALSDYRAERKQQAEIYFEKAVAVEPTRGDAWFFLGELRRARNDLKGAKQAYKASVDAGYDKAILELEKLRDVQ
jgi:superkiller protein 3